MNALSSGSTRPPRPPARSAVRRHGPLFPGPGSRPHAGRNRHLRGSGPRREIANHAPEPGEAGIPTRASGPAATSPRIMGE